MYQHVVFGGSTLGMSQPISVGFDAVRDPLYEKAWNRCFFPGEDKAGLTPEPTTCEFRSYVVARLPYTIYVMIIQYL